MQPDQYGRSISYLRLSITDRCNLRCLYCRGNMDERVLPHEELLRYEEMLELIALVRELGVRKVRLTGGEPLLRRNALGFMEQIFKRFPDLDLRLTTNATLLPGKARQLKEFGLERVNISLDTLRRGVFEAVTGADHYHDVRRAIDECLAQGLTVKINAVALRGINDADLADFVRFAATHPLDVRFIEFMPMGQGTAWKQEYFWSAQDIVAQASELADLTPLARNRQDTDATMGPARMFAIAGGQGRFGIISPLSDHFCGSCNRLRITCDGRLRTCLFSDRQYRLRPLLRHPKLGPTALLKVLELAGRHKPLGYQLLAKAAQNAREAAVCSSRMSGIGG